MLSENNENDNQQYIVSYCTNKINDLDYTVSGIIFACIQTNDINIIGLTRISSKKNADIYYI